MKTMGRKPFDAIANTLGSTHCDPEAIMARPHFDFVID